MMKYKTAIISTTITMGIMALLILSAILTNRGINTHKANTDFENRYCIVIDAGHGGVDGGAISCTGVEESQINLEISLRLNDFLHLLGIKTYMIRTEDVSIYTNGSSIAAKKVSDLKERVRIVNQTPNAILVSIHQNYFSDSRYSGAQVFYNKDAQLADYLQNAIVKFLNPYSHRKTKRADGIYLLQQINCQAALIECGFLSNPEEEALLRNPEYQKKLSCVIGAAISCYIFNASIT